MIATRTIAAVDEQVLIQKNVAELQTILAQRPLAAPELAPQKEKMQRIFEHLEEIGSRGAREYFNLAGRFGLNPRVVKLYAVAGMLRPKQPFKAHHSVRVPGKIYYSDLDLVVGVGKVSESLTKGRAIDMQVRLFRKEKILDEFKRAFLAREALASLNAVRREAGKPLLLKLEDATREERALIEVLRNRSPFEPIERTMAFVSLHHQFEGRLVKIIESKGIEDAEYCIDLQDNGRQLINGDLQEDKPHRLIGAARQE